ncbi:unnamed protein product, partial [Prorocentrum cordatum]
PPSLALSLPLLFSLPHPLSLSPSPHSLPHSPVEGKEFGWTVDGDFIKLSSNPRYCMSVREGKAGDGSDIILWNCADSTEFKWNIDEASGTVGFRADPKYKLSVRGGR